jgi:hypothetical protein
MLSLRVFFITIAILIIYSVCPSGASETSSKEQLRYEMNLADYDYVGNENGFEQYESSKEGIHVKVKIDGFGRYRDGMLCAPIKSANQNLEKIIQIMMQARYRSNGMACNPQQIVRQTKLAVSNTKETYSIDGLSVFKHKTDKELIISLVD